MACIGIVVYQFDYKMHFLYPVEPEELVHGTNNN